MLNMGLNASKFTDGVEGASKSIMDFMTARAGSSKQVDADDSIEHDLDTDGELSRSPLKRKLDHSHHQRAEMIDAKRTPIVKEERETREEASTVELVDDDRTATASNDGSFALPTSFADISPEALNSLPPEIRLELMQYYRSKQAPSASTTLASRSQSKSKPAAKSGKSKKTVAKKAMPAKKESPVKKQPAEKSSSAMYKLSDYFTQKH